MQFTDVLLVSFIESLLQMEILGVEFVVGLWQRCVAVEIELIEPSTVIADREREQRGRPVQLCCD